MSLGEEYIRVKTWVLRMSIHCDECRKNVENRLRSIDGVYIVKVDPGLGVVSVRVTMSPDLSPDVLLKKVKTRGKRSYVQLLVPPPAADDQDQDGPAALVVADHESNSADPPTEQPRPPSFRPSPARRRQPLMIAKNDNGEKELAEEEWPVLEVEQAGEEPAEEEEDQGHKDDNVVVVVLPPPTPPNINARAACGSRASSRVASPRVVNGPAGQSKMVKAEGMDGGQNMGPTHPDSYNMASQPTYDGLSPYFPFQGANYGDRNLYEHQLHGSYDMLPNYQLNPSSSYYHYYSAPPPPPTPTHKEECTYKFNDENTSSCTVM